MKPTFLVLVLLSGCATVHSPDAVADLAVRRAALISWLHDYRVAGVYPTDAEGLPRSVFVDARGVRCPMAEMIYKSGRPDLVTAVLMEGNAVRLADVHDGPLFDWMLASGLTQEEAVFVQGMMTIDELNELKANPNRSLRAAVAKGQVTGKLEVAEAMLRNATATSLVTAASRLPHKPLAKLAATPITGRVVPARNPTVVTVSRSR